MPAPRCTTTLAAVLLALPLTATADFDFADVAARAKQLAAETYRAPEADLPNALLDLNYDQYRDIRFKPEHALWHQDELPFELQFFHPGFLYREPVQVHVISDEEVHSLPFSPRAFDYGRNKLALKNINHIGYAGFRVHYAVNNPKYKDEVAVFLGASYFRALGRDQLYGLSARGLAVDTGEMSGEEFPAFREFWIEEPDDDAEALVFYALLDSRRVTGAYRFELRPGVDTQMRVLTRLYLREPVKKLGIAPLTSMYQFGENQPAPTEDYRPEVHDSDGLLIQNGNSEWIWRPLVNPGRLLVTSFGVQKLAGFGLQQRDRRFSHYQDLEARYHRRPSAWVKPLNDWGPGRVELVQIPTPDETNDNIVAYWIPDRVPDPGQPLDLSYQLSWQLKNLAQAPHSWVTQTRRGHGWRRDADDSLRFMVDFEGPGLRKLRPDAAPEAGLWLGDNGELLEQQLFRNEESGGWRLSLRLRRKDDAPLEMRAMLHHKGEVLSETWSYVLP